jgi:hypothetical protein
MGVLAWVIAPQLADQLSGPGALSRALIITVTAGLVWQFVPVVAGVSVASTRCSQRTTRERLYGS